MTRTEEGGLKGHLPAVVVGLVGGLLSGMFGVGGGIVLVPLLIGVLRLDRKTAHATSLAAVFVIALSGSIGYAAADQMDVGVGISLGMGGVVGAMYGARQLNRMSVPALRTTFAILLVATGFRMVIG